MLKYIVNGGKNDKSIKITMLNHRCACAIFVLCQLMGFRTVYSIFLGPFPPDKIENFLDKDSVLTSDGNYTIGGLFSAHVDYDPLTKTCSTLHVPGVLFIQAMIYAVEQANAKLVSGEKLGYRIVNDCYNIDRAMQASLQFMMGDDPLQRRSWVKSRTDIMNKARRTKDNHIVFELASPVIGVIGPANSDISAAVASLFSVNLLPLVSYSATSPKLSDKSKYPSFLRTIPPDGAQVTAMADLITHFNWTWVSVIATDDNYGRYGLQLLKEILNDRNVCLAREELIDSRLSNESIRYALNKLQSTELGKRANVVIFICNGAKVDPFLKVMKSMNVTDKTWIASESWGYRVFSNEYEQILSGSLGIATDDDFPQEFYEYLMDLPFRKVNPWFQQYLNSEAVSHGEGIWFKNSSRPVNEHPAAPHLTTENWSVWFWQVPKVLNAVNSVVKAFKKAVIHKSVMYPFEILQYLHELTFDDFGNKTATFKYDDNGDVMDGYKINNMQPINDHRFIRFVPVGRWDGTNWTLDNPMRPQETEFDKKRLQLNEPEIVWKDNSSTMPVSRCRSECSPGTYKIFSSMRCCWDCIPCPTGKFTARMAQTACRMCPAGMTNNDDFTGCVYIEEYIDWKTPTELVILTLAFIGQIGVGIVTIIMVRYRKTPVVVCSNRPLNFILLLLLFVAFTLPFLFIIRPNPVLCSSEAVIFGVVFSTITAILLVKTRHVMRIFNTRLQAMGDSVVYRRELWQSGLFALVAVIITVPFLIANPPQPLPHSADCGTSWVIVQFVNLGYIMILSLVATAVAFKARHLPENYNETGTISTTMLLLLLVWVACLPSYYRLFVRQRTLLLSIAINAAAYLILLSLFGSKVYLIYWEPHKNTSAFVARMNMIHIWKKYNKAERKRRKKDSIQLQHEQTQPSFQGRSSEGIIETLVHTPQLTQFTPICEHEKL